MIVREGFKEKTWLTHYSLQLFSSPGLLPPPRPHQERETESTLCSYKNILHNILCKQKVCSICSLVTWTAPQRTIALPSSLHAEQMRLHHSRTLNTWHSTYVTFLESQEVTPWKDTSADINVNGCVGQAIQQKLLVDDVLAWECMDHRSTLLGLWKGTRTVEVVKVRGNQKNFPT